MSAEYAQGAMLSTQKAGTPVYPAFQYTTTTSTTATSTGLTIEASTTNPVIVMAEVVVTTADAGTTPTISFGYTASGYTDLINAASTATAATGGTFLPASNAVGKKYLTANTEIFYKQGGTPAGGGVVTLLLHIIPVQLALT